MCECDPKKPTSFCENPGCGWPTHEKINEPITLDGMKILLQKIYYILNKLNAGQNILDDTLRASRGLAPIHKEY